MILQICDGLSASRYAMPQKLIAEFKSDLTRTITSTLSRKEFDDKWGRFKIAHDAKFLPAPPELPKRENYGFHTQNGVDDEPTGWLIEDGKEAYDQAMQRYADYLDHLKQLVKAMEFVVTEAGR